MSSASSVANARLISTDGVADAVHHAIQLFIGPHRAWSDDDVATALTAAGHDIKARTVASWRAGNPIDRRTPPTDVLLKLCQMLGAAFTAKVVGAIGQGAYPLTGTKLLPPEVVAVLSEGLSEFALRAVDGVYCNVDQGALERFADRMIDALTPFSSKRGE